jgi:hypothetical protein
MKVDAAFRGFRREVGCFVAKSQCHNLNLCSGLFLALPEGGRDYRRGDWFQYLFLKALNDGTV